MKTHSRLLLMPCIGAALTGLTLAHAASAPAADAPEYRVSQFERAISVDDAGRATTRVTVSVVLSTDAALRRFSQYAVPYNADTQSLTIDEAETQHPDGQRVNADLGSAVFDRPAPATVSAPLFSAEHLRIVAFPATSVGDTVHLHYTLQDHETMFPGKFAEIVDYPPTEAFDDVKETLDTPAGMAVRIEAHGLRADGDTVNGARRIRMYRYRTPPTGPLAAQGDSVAAIDAGPYFVATNFADYAEVGQAYEQGARPQAQVTPAIQSRADEITANVSDRRAQAMLIYDWVSRNIRYLLAWVGTGPVVPHSADSVLRNGYGDCKDHVTLFIALLAAKGIHADSVLVNLGNSYRLPNAPAWILFNHAITWLPEFGVFADTTNGFAPFGILPFSVSDKPALDTVTGQMLHTPPQNGANSTSATDYAIAVHDDGDAELTGSITLSGQARIGPGRQLAQYASGRIAYDLMRQSGLNGTLHVAATKREAPGALRFDLKSTIDNMAIMPGPAALAIPTMPNYGSIRGFADYVLRQAGQPLDGPCSGTALREHYRVTLPADATIIAIPPDVDTRSGDVAYTARYHRNGQTVEIDRVLERNFHTNVCSAAMLQQLSPAARVISGDLKRQILYR